MEVRHSLIVFAGDSAAFVLNHWFGLLVLVAVAVLWRSVWRWFFR